MFPAATLAQMRARSERSMRDRWIVDVPGEWIDDGVGGGYYGPGTTRTVPCRKGDPREREALIAHQIQTAGTAVLIVPLDADLGPDTAGTYVPYGSTTGVRYAVVGEAEYTYRVDRRLIVAPEHTQAGT